MNIFEKEFEREFEKASGILFIKMRKQMMHHKVLSMKKKIL